MILIIGKNDLDTSTEAVIDYLEYTNKKWLRINGDDIINSTIHITNDNINKYVKNDEIAVVWYRRLLNDDIFLNVFDEKNISNHNAIKLYNFLRDEIRVLINLFMDSLKTKNWLTRPEELRISKLEMLFSAKKLNIRIPDTIITTSKMELLNFKNRYERIITKCISDSCVLRHGKNAFIMNTQEVKGEFIEKLDSVFSISLFQELVEKNYEIRSFFLEGRFYSMAIFSQNDEQTKIDFRNYNRKNPNRTVPYKLPDDVENQLRDLMLINKITTASLDIIKSINGDYVFLECNPVGQFGMISDPCNYYLEEKIAAYLSKK